LTFTLFYVYMDVFDRVHQDAFRTRDSSYLGVHMYYVV